jgi:hypothetical protein
LKGKNPIENGQETWTDDWQEKVLKCLLNTWKNDPSHNKWSDTDVSSLTPQIGKNYNPDIAISWWGIGRTGTQVYFWYHSFGVSVSSKVTYGCTIDSTVLLLEIYPEDNLNQPRNTYAKSYSFVALLVKVQH